MATISLCMIVKNEEKVLARTHFEGLEELEAGILWVSPAHGEVLDEAAWYQLLTTSMEGFSLTEA